VHGRHSRDLPAHLAERYEQMLADPEISGLRDEIALVHAAIIDRLERLVAIPAIPFSQQYAARCLDGYCLKGAREVLERLNHVP
jgi:hypothetical protein